MRDNPHILQIMTFKKRGWKRITIIAGTLVFILLFLGFRWIRFAQDYSCSFQIQQLAYSLEQYLSDQKNFPPNLEVLSNSGILKDSQLFYCPTSHLKYRYHFPAKADSDTTIILSCLKHSRNKSPWTKNPLRPAIE